MSEKQYVLDGSSPAERFIRALTSLSDDELRRLQKVVAASWSTAAGEISWWHAICSLDRQLVRSGRARIAHLAASRARQAVLDVGATQGVVDNEELLQIARSAGDAVEALIAPSGPHLVVLLEPWREVYKRSRLTSAKANAA